MELIQLKVFLECNERGSFRRAAEALSMAQPSVSARVQALEDELGAPLFHRLARGVRLTEFGKVFLPYAQSAMDTLSQGREVLEGARRTSHRRLKIAASRVLGAYVLPCILQQYHRKYPDVSFQITVCRSTKVLKMLLDEDVQLGLARSLKHPDVESIHIFDEEIVLVTHPNHRFAGGGEVSIQEVADESLILYDPGSQYFELINRVYSDAGIRPRVGMHLDGMEATKNMVKLGLGISFLPLSAVREELQNGALATIHVIESQKMTIPFHILIRRAQYYSPTVLAFLELLEQMHKIDVPLLRERVSTGQMN